MKTRHSLLCGIAILAIAGVTPAMAQSDSTATETASPQASDAPAAHHAKHHSMRGDSGPQYSTPEEKAATDQLNQQQLQQAQQSLSQIEAAASMRQTTGPTTPGAQPTDMQPANPGAQPTDAQPSTGSAPQNNGPPQQ